MPHFASGLLISSTPWHATPPAGDTWGALVRYLLLAEQGCTTAATNAAFMLRQGQGFTGAGAKELAARLYFRSARTRRAACVEARAHSPACVLTGGACVRTQGHAAGQRVRRRAAGLHGAQR